MGGKNKAGRNDRKTKSFNERYGMTKAEWATYKKEHTKAEAQEVRNNARARLKK